MTDIADIFTRVILGGRAVSAADVCELTFTKETDDVTKRRQSALIADKLHQDVREVLLISALQDLLQNPHAWPLPPEEPESTDPYKVRPVDAWWFPVAGNLLEFRLVKRSFYLAEGLALNHIHFGSSGSEVWLSALAFTYLREAIKYFGMSR